MLGLSIQIARHLDNTGLQSIFLKRARVIKMRSSKIPRNIRRMRDDGEEDWHRERQIWDGVHDSRGNNVCSLPHLLVDQDCRLAHLNFYVRVHTLEVARMG